VSIYQQNLFWILLLFVGYRTPIDANLTSPTGEITFDVNTNGQTDMILNNNGLGVGKATASSNIDVAGNAIISKTLSIGTQVSSSNLNLGGAIGMSHQTLSDNGSISAHSLVFFDSSAGNLSLTLPDISNIEGRVLFFKKINSLNGVTLSSNTFIDGNLTGFIFESGTPLPSLKLIATDTEWRILNQSNNITPLSIGNLIAQWKLDEISGTAVADATGNGYDGTASGISLPSDSILAKQNTGFVLNNASDEITIDTIPDMTNWSSFSIGAWVYYDSSGSNEHTIFSSWVGTPSTHASVLLRLEPADDTVECFVRNSVGTQLGGTFGDTSITPNAWHHVFATYDQTNGIQVYVNGNVSSTTYAANGVLGGTSITDMSFGKSPHNSSDDFFGRIDDVRIYSKALSASEINVLYLHAF